MVLLACAALDRDATRPVVEELHVEAVSIAVVVRSSRRHESDVALEGLSSVVRPGFCKLPANRSGHALDMRWACAEHVNRHALGVRQNEIQMLQRGDSHAAAMRSACVRHVLGTAYPALVCGRHTAAMCQACVSMG